MIETKVIAATAGAGGGGIVAAFFLWLAGVTIWGVPFDAAHSAAAQSAVPSQVGALVVLVVAALGALAGGYAAPHTDRPDLAPKPTAAPSGAAFIPVPDVPSGWEPPSAAIVKEAPALANPVTVPPPGPPVVYPRP